MMNIGEIPMQSRNGLVTSLAWGIDGKVSYLNNISLTFSFSCEDEKGNTHYYRAVANIASTQHFHKELWDVKKVG